MLSKSEACSPGQRPQGSRPLSGWSGFRLRQHSGSTPTAFPSAAMSRARQCWRTCSGVGGPIQQWWSSVWKKSFQDDLSSCISSAFPLSVMVTLSSFRCLRWRQRVMNGSRNHRLPSAGSEVRNSSAGNSSTSSPSTSANQKERRGKAGEMISDLSFDPSNWCSLWWNGNKKRTDCQNPVPPHACGFLGLEWYTSLGVEVFNNNKKVNRNFQTTRLFCIQGIPPRKSASKMKNSTDMVLLNIGHNVLLTRT